MSRLTVGSYTVRVWRTEESLEAATNGLAGAELRALRGALALEMSVPRMFAIIEERIERIAAIEILNGDGCGALVYPDWK